MYSYVNTMFTKQFCRSLRWLQRDRCIPLPEILCRLSYCKHASRQVLEDILANPGPESKLPAGMYTEFKDMDPEMQETFKKIIKCEYKVQRRQELNKIVDVMTEDMWEKLYHARTPSDRQLVMETFHQEQMGKQFMEREKTNSGQQSPTVDTEVEKRIKPYSSRIPNKVVGFICKSSLAVCHQHRTITSRFHGSNLVIDVKDVHKMKMRSQMNVLRSVSSALELNSTARQPFHVVLCNSNLKQMSIQTKWYDISKADITEKSYLDLFPKRELVYLSPSATKTVEFDPRITYIIGGLSSNEHQDFSLARAKEDNIRFQQLPLQEFFSHIKSKLAIPIHEVLLIMLSLKDNDGRYMEAFESILRKPKGPHNLSKLLKGYYDSLDGGPSTEEEIHIVRSLYRDFGKKKESSPGQPQNKRWWES